MIWNMQEDARNNKVVDMIKPYNHITFDFIGDFAFAEPFDNLKTRNNHPFMITIFSDLRTAVTVQTLVAAFPPLRILAQQLRRVLQRFDFEKFVHEKAESCIKDGNRERPDLISGILKHNTENGTGIIRNEIEATARVLLVAGSETTATLLSGCTYLLLRNPRVVKKLQDEIQGSFAASDDISITKLNQISYLRCTGGISSIVSACPYRLAESHASRRNVNLQLLYSRKCKYQLSSHHVFGTKSIYFPKRLSLVFLNTPYTSTRTTLPTLGDLSLSGTC
jgi:cytochrome P450